MSKNMVKRVVAVGLSFTMAIVAVLMGMPVEMEAAQNPLENMPSESASIVSCSLGMGCDFYTPEYTQEFTMTAQSSNPDVATVEVYDFGGNGTWSKGYYVDRKGYGTTKIKVKVKIGKKTYTKTCKYTFYKYKNPFSEFKIGSNSLNKKLNKKYSLSVDDKYLTGKINYKLKSGYKIDSIYAITTDSSKTIEKGKKLPQDTTVLYIVVQDKKTKANLCIGITRNSEDQ